jgi:hypothetical protein
MTPGQASAQGKILRIEGGIYAAHVFDLPDGLAFIETGWADDFGGGTNRCHRLQGTPVPFDFQGGGWLLDGPGEPLVQPYTGPERPDGPRAKAREILARDLQIKIPDDS